MFGLVVLRACTGSCFSEELNANVLLPGCHRTFRTARNGLLRRVMQVLPYRFLVNPGFKVTLRSCVTTGVDTEKVTCRQHSILKDLAFSGLVFSLHFGLKS